jgi:glycosyltransferase involved in cell wall biosynthesis
MKTAIVHDWLVTSGGSEKVLEQMLMVFPGADVFTLVDFMPGDKRGFLAGSKVSTSMIQRLPFAKRKYRSYLPLMPFAVEQFDLSDYDLVISNSHAVAKGVFTTASQLHICYCCTPMRYAWDLHHLYLREAGLNGSVKGLVARAVLHYMRLWDHSTSGRADLYVAASRYVASKIKKIYGRDSEVIYPPVDTETFTPGGGREDFYLTASRMVPYKRMDAIVEAFAGMPSRKLVVIGDGPDRRKITSKASGNIKVLGYQPIEVLKDYMQRARAFVFAAVEDFGIINVEAQACGTPVIACGRGGSLETVIDGETGLFFDEQTPEAIARAAGRFEEIEHTLDPAGIRRNAERFDAQRFREGLRAIIEGHPSKERLPSGRPPSLSSEVSPRPATGSSFSHTRNPGQPYTRS